MPKTTSLFYNFIFNLIKTINSILFPIISFTYAARVLGVDGVGQVSFSKSFVSYFVMIAMLGMNYYGTREAAKRRDNNEELSRFCIEMLIINSFSTVFAYLLLAVGMLCIPTLQRYETLLLICSIGIVLQGIGMEWLYQAMEDYRYIAVRSALFQIVALIAMFLFVRDEEDVIPYAVITLLASSGSYILNFFNARKYVHWRQQAQYNIKKHLKPLLWLFAMTVSIELYTVLDSTMLGFLKGDTAVGLYTAAIKVERLINTLIISVGVVLIPRLSYYASHQEIEKIMALSTKAYNFVFLLSVPAAVGLFLLSDEIILLFSGSAFLAAGFTMRLLTPIVLLIPFSVLTNQQIFIPMGFEKLILISTGVGAITNFISNCVLIPLYAENGAAIATVFAETIVAIVCFLNANHYFRMRDIFKTYAQYWIAALPIVPIVLLLKASHLNYILYLALAVALSAVCYVVLLILMKNPYIREALGIAKSQFLRKRN